MQRRVSTSALALLMAALSLSAHGPARADIGTRPASIPRPDIHLRGQLHLPAQSDEARHPGALLLHGWLPEGTDGAVQMTRLAKGLARRGWVALTLAMRGWPPTGGVDDCGQRQVGDVRAAASWLAAQPEVAPARVALVGHSQGGQVALLAAAAGAPVAAVVAYAPVTDLRLWRQMSDIPGIVDYVDEECSAGPGLSPRSPVEQVEAIERPVLVLHGDADRRVGLLQSVRFVASLRARGGQAELWIRPGAGHPWWELGDAEDVTGWLERVVPGPRSGSPSAGGVAR
jgi:dipeptidyl aminopeptidase/acylaminoacyl peptidase